MRPDGSIIFGRFNEPQTFIQLPLDLRSADDVEKRIRIADRRLKRQVKVH
jgi:hypothetical protein